MAPAQALIEKAESSLRFRKYAYKYWKPQVGIIALNLLNVPLGLAAPYLVKIVIDEAYSKGSLKIFFVTAFIGGIIFVINALFSVINNYLSNRLSRKLQFELGRDLFRHLQYVPARFFDEHSTGEFIYRVYGDARSVSDFLSRVAPQIAMIIARTCFLLIIIFYLNWRLAVFSALLLPFTYLHPYFFGRRIRSAMQWQVNKSQQIFRFLQEVFSHIRLVKAYGKEKNEITRFEQDLEQTMNLELRTNQLTNISGFTGSVFNKALGGVIALYGGYQVINGQMTLGSLTAVLLYVGQLLDALRSAGDLYHSHLVNSVSRHRIAEIFSVTALVDDGVGVIDCPIEKGEISFEDVTFSYKRKIYVLKGVSFLIKGGSRIALVGPSGSGKTTILSLLLRLYQPESGAILIDGVAIEKFKLSSLRAQIGIVLQEPWLWNDTIANNIRYGKDNADMDEIIQAAQLAQAHDFIMRLHNGYDTAIGELACKLSEGQKQRLALARAFIRGPKILLLDEAMSCLDSETEGKIIDAIMQRFPTTTVLIVSHRLSAVRKADLVYYLQDGIHMLTGTHGQLLDQSRCYRALFTGQINQNKDNGCVA